MPSSGSLLEQTIHCARRWTNSFVLEDSLKKALRCRNMQEFDTCYELYFIKFVDILMVCRYERFG